LVIREHDDLRDVQNEHLLFFPQILAMKIIICTMERNFNPTGEADEIIT
jgi:hypothetical protein